MDDSAAFFNRDLSWLEFNDRVLAQAERADLPLLERVKFFAIYSSNLDEFFQKRVGLIKARLAHPATRDRLTHEGLTLTELLTQIRGLVVGQQSRQAELWEGGLVPALEAEGIGVRKYADLKKPARKKLDAWFDGNVFSVLTPLAVDPSHRFPFISNLSENFGLVLTRNADPQDRVFARVKIPGVVSRFVPVPDDEMQSYVALDDLMAHNLDRLFPGLTIQDVAPFRVTRSAAVAGMEDDDEIDDVLQHVEDELRRRRFAAAVRVEAPPDAPPNVLEFVTGQLGLEAEDLYLRAGPLEHQDLFELASLPRPDLKLTPWTPVIPKALRDLTPLEDEDDPVVRVVADGDAPAGSIFEHIRREDILLHHPYESFKYSVERFVAEAADDPDVLAIKQTIYRTSPDSPFVRSLIRAADAGKNVACLVELRARFDEERNVAFARQLEHAGVHVAYGVVGLKTHCKCSLVVRRERPAGAERGGEELRAYAHIGTGNYHPKTAQLYTDLGLLTADPALTRDVVRVFNTLTGHAAEQDFERLLVAPQTMRSTFTELVEREIENAGRGKPARIVVKMNQLEDRKITRKLYEASQAGVEVTCIVRGFCCLRPGIKGLSENIRVFSVIGRFLEHSRIFHFADGHEDPYDGRYYIGSADWMYRNLNDRLEAATPIDHRGAKARLWHIFEVMTRDGLNAWDLRPDGTYEHRRPDESAAEDTPERVGTFRALMTETMRE